jgi:hypothetical protein
MSCKIDSRILSAKDSNELTNVELVALSSKLSASDKLHAKTFAVILAELDGQFIRIGNQLNAQIPANAELVRDSKQQLVGIPAVAGG